MIPDYHEGEDLAILRRVAALFSMFPPVYQSSYLMALLPLCISL